MNNGICQWNSGGTIPDKTKIWGEEKKNKNTQKPPKTINTYSHLSVIVNTAKVDNDTIRKIKHGLDHKESSIMCFKGVGFIFCKA